jgi:hypothetical protein
MIPLKGDFSKRQKLKSFCLESFSLQGPIFYPSSKRQKLKSFCLESFSLRGEKEKAKAFSRKENDPPKGGFLKKTEA